MKSFCLAYEEFLPCIYKYAPIASTRHILLRHSEDSEKSLCTFDLSLRLYCDYARLIYKFIVPWNGALFGIAGDPTMLNGMSTSVLITAVRVYQMEEPQLILCVCLKCILLHGVLGNLTTNKDAAAYCCATIKDSTARALVFRVFSMDTSGSTY